jgi:predicted DNA binding CopG/RHH family protein
MIEIRKRWVMIRQIKLNRREKEIETALLRGEYVDVDKKEFHAIAEAIARRKKDAVLNIRVNSQDLKSIKQRAKRIGIGYQTFISELIHRVA